MGFSGGKGGAPQSVQHPAISGLQIQTSALGKAIQLAYGASRAGESGAAASPAFAAAAPHAVFPATGRRACGIALKSPYHYQTGVAIGLCEGPIAGVNTIYANRQVRPHSISRFPSAAKLGLGRGDSALVGRRRHASQLDALTNTRNGLCLELQFAMPLAPRGGVLPRKYSSTSPHRRKYLRTRIKRAAAYQSTLSFTVASE